MTLVRFFATFTANICRISHVRNLTVLKINIKNRRRVFKFLNYISSNTVYHKYILLQKCFSKYNEYTSLNNQKCILSLVFTIKCTAYQLKTITYINTPLCNIY